MKRPDMERVDKLLESSDQAYSKKHPESKSVW